ncbi:hypothetical protein GMDG_00567, partial [Pseudogymnoascus destructans 20631-21]
AVKSVVRWLRNENTTRYFEKHPVARDAIVTAVREVTHSTALATPISTPYNPRTSIDQPLTSLSSPSIAYEESDPGDQTSTLLLPLDNAQTERVDLNGSTDPRKLSLEASDQTSPAAQQELDNGSQPQCCSSIKQGDTLDSEHGTSDSQHSASLGASTPAEHNDVSDNDAHPNGLPSTQTPTSLVQYRSNTARRKSRKRKHNSEDYNTTDAELGDKSLEGSKQITSQPVPIRDEQFGQHPEMLEGVQDTQPSIAVTRATPASTPYNTDIPGEPAPARDVEDSSGDSQHAANLDDLLPSSDGDDRQDGWSSGDSQPSANLDDWISSSDGDDCQDGWSSGDSQHAANLDDLLPSSKADCRGLQPLDGTEVYLGSRSPQLSETYELQSAPDRKYETHGQRPDTSDAGQDLVSRHSSEPPSATELPEEESNRSTKIPADLRAKLRMIGDESTLAALMDYVNYTANPPSSADYCADTLEDYQGPDTTSDQRFRVLRNRIVRDEAGEEITKYLRVSFRISKRFALAELSIRYAEAKDARSAVPKKRRKLEFPGLSPRGRFTDSLSPELGDIEGEEERNKARETAKGKFSYWITQGDPLAELAKQFGSLVLAILPENLTVTE